MGRTGAERANDFLMMHYDQDDRGRLVSVRGEGPLPHFVWVRAAEGTVWRFRFDLPNELVAKVAKLAGRERGWKDREDEDPAPPERLEMITRLLSEEAPAVQPRREKIEEGGALALEIWRFEDA